MGTLNAFYVRASDPTSVTAVRAAYPSAYTDPAMTFYVIPQSDDCFDCPEAELRSLSARLGTDVIWLSFQTVVDAFQYHHWSNGIHVRSLVYGCFESEREWERVEGSPEPWESHVLFGNLSDELRYCDDEDERRAIERVYQERVIEPGTSMPSVDARETARGVAEFFRFPGWSLSG